MIQPPIKNEKLRRTVIESARSHRQSVRRLHSKKLALAKKVEHIIDQIDGRFNWFLGDEWLFVPIGDRGNDKAAFSESVKIMAGILGEPPEIQVRAGEYMAEFPEGRVHLYLSGPADCRVVTMTETTETTRPHPECVAALTALEEVI